MDRVDERYEAFQCHRHARSRPVGLLLLSGYCGPLTLTVLAASSTISLAFHLTLAPASITPAPEASLLWVLVFLQYRERLKGIFSAKPATQPRIAF